VIQGTFGAIQETFGVIRGTFGEIRGTFVIDGGSADNVAKLLPWRLPVDLHTAHNRND
jgi:hypothetical protein